MSGRVAGVALAGLLLASLPTTARELAGVTMPDTLTVGARMLALNGVGLRKKALFKVYVGALYLETPSKDATAILGSDQAKAVRMHFLRDLSRDQLTGAFTEGFEANAREKAAGQKDGITTFLAMIPAVKEGEELTLAYAPGVGTTVLRGAQASGVIAGREFGEMLFAVWLGPVPPTEDLKKGMLGL